jgi:hypothetical protein
LAYLDKKTEEAAAVRKREECEREIRQDKKVQDRIRKYTSEAGQDKTRQDKIR